MTVILLGFLVSCSQTKTTEEAKERGASQTVEPAAPDFRIIEAQSEPDTLKGSIKARATGTIGNVNVTIDYYSPAVRGRMIWGGLVPYDNVGDRSSPCNKHRVLRECGHRWINYSGWQVRFVHYSGKE